LDAVEASNPSKSIEIRSKEALSVEFFIHFDDNEIMGNFCPLRSSPYFYGRPCQSSESSAHVIEISPVLEPMRIDLWKPLARLFRWKKNRTETVETGNWQ
jgi:hypothetical protein